MGTPVGGNTVADLPDTPPPVALPNQNAQYEGVLNGMRRLTVRPEQFQPYQNYSIQAHTQVSSPQQNAYTGNYGAQQFNNVNYSPADPWATTQPIPQPSQYQPYREQQRSPTSDWNSFAQPPQQQNPVPAQAHAASSMWPGQNHHQLPRLNHPVPSHGTSPHGGQQNGYYPQGNGHEAAVFQYGDDDDSEEQSASGGDRACADHKSSTDVMREYGAGLRALRLLDETTKNYNDDEDCPRRGGGLRQAAKHEHAKQMKAKQIRKMKKLEYKNKKAGMLAESSRTVTSVRRGYDPELTADKCQLDFDRQRDAQAKALKLMSSMF